MFVLFGDAARKLSLFELGHGHPTNTSKGIENGMEWNGIKQDRTEPNGTERKGTESNGIERNGTKPNQMERNRMEHIN